MSLSKYSIPTEYKGITFRSRLEAQWADWFDDHDIKWEYEPEGYKLPWKNSTIKYLPDFFLPEMNSFFEVKGVMEEFDKEKLFALARAVRNERKDGLERVFVGGLEVGKDLALVHADEKSKGFGYLGLAKCENCQRYFFINPVSSGICLYCGHANEEKAEEAMSEAFHTSDYFESLNGVVRKPKEKRSPFALLCKDHFRIIFELPELRDRTLEQLGRILSNEKHLSNEESLLFTILRDKGPSQLELGLQETVAKGDLTDRAAAALLKEVQDLLTTSIDLEGAERILNTTDRYEKIRQIENEMSEIDRLLPQVKEESERRSLLVKRIQLRRKLEAFRIGEERT